MFKGDIETVQCLEEVLTGKCTGGQRVDDFLDLHGDDIFLHEVARLEHTSENALGEDVLDEHFLDSGLGKIGVQRTVAKDDKAGQCIPEDGVLPLLFRDDVRKGAAMFCDAVLEFSARLLPLLDGRLVVVEEGAQRIRELVGTGQCTVEDACAILIEHGTVGGLEEDILFWITKTELGFNLLFQIIRTVLRFPDAVDKIELIHDCTVRAERPLAGTMDRVFGNKLPADLSRAIIEQHLERGPHSGLMRDTKRREVLP